MLLGQKKRNWNIVYKDEHGNITKSEDMDKRIALEYLEIFDDAIYVESKSGKRIPKEKSLKEITKIKKRQSYLIITGFILWAILFIISIIFNWRIK